MNRECKSCKIPKPLEDFRKKGNYYSHKCRKCEALQNKAWRHRNPEKAKSYYNYTPGQKIFKRDIWLKRSYGIDLDTYNKMLECQGGVCAICSKPETRDKSKYLAVDHCHTTNRVRGLLCAKCNTLIAYAQDSQSHLLKAVDYLNKFQ